MTKEQMQGIFEAQLARLQEAHFLVLYWTMTSEDRGVKYNITNIFDDLKNAGLTRTKQTAVAIVDSLVSLCYIDLREEQNRKNVYLTKFGGLALKNIAELKKFEVKASNYLEKFK